MCPVLYKRDRSIADLVLSFFPIFSSCCFFSYYEGEKDDAVAAVGHGGLALVNDAWRASGACDVKGGRRGSSLQHTWIRANEDGNNSAARFDRVLDNRLGISVLPVDEGGYVLIGRDPIDYPNAEKQGYRTPSDHFGLVVTYILEDAKPSSSSSSSLLSSSSSLSSSSTSSSSSSSSAPIVVPPAALPHSSLPQPSGSAAAVYIMIEDDEDDDDDDDVVILGRGPSPSTTSSSSSSFSSSSGSAARSASSSAYPIPVASTAAGRGVRVSGSSGGSGSSSSSSSSSSSGSSSSSSSGGSSSGAGRSSSSAPSSSAVGSSQPRSLLPPSAKATSVASVISGSTEVFAFTPDDVCAICLDNFDPSQLAKKGYQLPQCGPHYFHSECIRLVSIIVLPRYSKELFI